MHLRPGRSQSARRPVPPIRRLHHHLRRHPRPGDLPAQLRRAVSEPRGLQLPAIRTHPHQHTAAPVQVHPDDLPAVISFGHKGLPTWWRRMHATSSIRQKRRPASSSHQTVTALARSSPPTCRDGGRPLARSRLLPRISRARDLPDPDCQLGKSVSLVGSRPPASSILRSSRGLTTMAISSGGARSSDEAILVSV